MSYKVEINVGGVWLPATHKYFQTPETAKDFERRFINANFPAVPQQTRVRKVGRDPKNNINNDFFGGWDELI